MDGKTLILVLCFVFKVSSLKVSVYYESLCPDSIRFITTQLKPTYNALKFNVELIPYGKAVHNTNPWSYNCQHGPNECFGNAVQACALNKITAEKDQVAFVGCVMAESYPPTAGKKCADELQLNYEGVANCSTNVQGQQLLAKLGDKTHSLSPRLSFVPTIIINDVYDDNTQNLALRNLPAAICNADPTVEGCSKIQRKFTNYYFFKK